MADSYTILSEKYKRLLMEIREISQERDDAKRLFDDLKESHTQTEKSMKYLCESILKKERGSNDEKTWFKMSLKDMIDKAQEGFEAYSASMKDMIQNLLSQNEKRREEKENLERELREEKESHKADVSKITKYKDEIIDSLIAKMKTGKVEDDEIDEIMHKVGRSQKENINMSVGSNVEFETESSDDMGKIISDSARIMYENGEVIVNTKPVSKVKVDDEAKIAVAKTADEISKERTEVVRKYVKKLSDPQKLLIRVMGEDGYSEMDPILKAAKQKYPELPSESRLKTAMHDLCIVSKEDELYEKIIEVVKCPVPGSSNFCLYRLTKMGNDIFTYLYSKAPKEPEMNLIIKNHDNLEHGYGIKKTALLLQKMKFIQDAKAEVIYLTRIKDYIVKVGENKKYIPDIVLVYQRADGKERRNYIEYETGKSPDTDMIAKCNKMASFTKNIFIIVPDKTAKDKTIEKIQKWKDSILKDGAPFPRKDAIRIRLGTFYEIRDSNSSNEISWKWDKTFSPPKK